MGLRINNLFALKANNQLLRTQKAIARSLERLSSGQRVTGAQDDIVALSRNSGLTAQIRGLAAANLGINSALGMIATAESAVSAQMDIVHRMKEIALRASNGTATVEDRANLNQELESLYAEYQRIATQTSFDGTNLLDGSFSLKTIQLGASKGDKLQFGIESTTASRIIVQDNTYGTGAFATSVTSATAGTSWGLTTADFNGDGNADVAVADGTAIDIFLGNGNGTFAARRTLASTAKYIEQADFNGDGNVDLVTSSEGSTMDIILGNGNGTFAARTTLAPGGTIHAWMSIGDMNGDAKQDIVVSNYTDNTTSVLLGNGNGTFAARVTLGSGSNEVALADLNGDGYLDVLMAWGNANAALGNGNGTFGAVTGTAVGTSPVGIDAGDLNGDGKVDVVTADMASLTGSILLGNGNGTFAAKTNAPAGTERFSVRLTDLNGDGYLDMLNMGQNDVWSLNINLGNGNGTFKPTTVALTAITNWPSFAVDDFTGDGVKDIVAANSWSSTISLLVGNSTTVTEAATISVATQEDAEALLTALDNAVSNLQDVQGNLSAIHSRLDETVVGNLLLSENLQEARSVSMDVDFATEVAELVKNQILQDVQVAVLTQANLQVKLVAQLLKN